MAVFVNKVTRKVIELKDNHWMTQDEVLEPFVVGDMLPEGVHCVQVRMDYRTLATVSVNEGTDAYALSKGVEIAEQLYVYDHSGISLYSGANNSNCWDTTTAGYIKVKADTAELAKQHLDAMVKAWDDYYRFGITDALMYESLSNYSQGGHCDDQMTVEAGVREKEQVIEAATAFDILGNEDDWVWMWQLDNGVVLAELRSLINIPEPELASDLKNGDLLDAARTLLDALK